MRLVVVLENIKFRCKDIKRNNTNKIKRNKFIEFPIFFML